MRLIDIVPDDEITEGVKRQYKNVGGVMKKRFRCSGGKKKGKLVSKASLCFQRKDPKKVRRGRKLMRIKKAVITRKSKVTKRRQISKLVARMNKRLSGR